METAIMNTLTKADKALVINGGSFGERFVELLTLHEIPYDEIKLEHGKALKPEHLAPYEGKGYTAFLLQKHETSTGVHYDINLVSDFCKRNGCFLIVDTISTFLCDPFDMAELNAGVMITGSQKALACPPGIAVMVLAPSAEIISESLSNAVTPLHPTTRSAYEIFLKIKDDYGMWICPNGGDMKDSVFRVGHIGNLTVADFDKLIEAFVDMQTKRFI